MLGDDRWLWWWAPVDRLSTVSAKDGSGFQMFAAVTFSSTAVEYTGLTTTGPLFLMEELAKDDGGHVQGKIAYSDGVSPTKPYLVPDNPNDDYGSPAFANTHVGFMKGITQKSLNVYDSVEIWATPYSTNPGELKPELVGTYPYTSMGYLVGGWGRLGTIEGVPGGCLESRHLVNLDEVGQEAIQRSRQDHFPSAVLGVTRTHLWVGGNDNGFGSLPHALQGRMSGAKPNEGQRQDMGQEAERPLDLGPHPDRHPRRALRGHDAPPHPRARLRRVAPHGCDLGGVLR